MCLRSKIDELEVKLGKHSSVANLTEVDSALLLN